MKKNRIKLTHPALKTRAEVEQTLRSIAEITLARNQAQLDMDTEITLVRERYESAIADANKALAERTDLVRAWADANPAEFTGARGLAIKSITFTHATIGFRTGTPTLKTLTGWTWDRVLEKMKLVGGWSKYLRVKEEINKQTLIVDRESIGDDQLRTIGLRVLQTESFFIDPKIETPENKLQTP